MAQTPTQKKASLTAAISDIQAEIDSLASAIFAENAVAKAHAAELSRTIVRLTAVDVHACDVLGA